MTLFGHDLTQARPLSQPGQYLAQERVTLQGPKGTFSMVAVLGPCRKEGQVELSATDALALGAFRDAYQLVPRSFGGDLAARPGVHTAATMAGLAFTQAGLGVCHAMAHSLGGQFHIPHGRLNAILLPAVITCNAPAAGEKYAALARAIGLEGRAVSVGVRNLRSALLRLRRELGLPDTLSRAGISPAQVRQKADAIIKAALADPCCGSNPMPVTESMVRNILSEVTGHG